jgi:hypothetical protein
MRSRSLTRVVRREYLLMLIGGCTVSASMPDNAELIISLEEGLYTSPPCEERDPARYVTFTEISTAAQARAAKLRPEPKCRDSRFEKPGGSFAGHSGGFAESLMTYEKPSRWNPDGTWNW